MKADLDEIQEEIVQQELLEISVGSLTRWYCKVFQPITKPILSYDFKIKNSNGIYFYRYKDDLNPLNGVYSIDIYIQDADANDIEIVENGLKKRTLKYDLPYKDYIYTNVNEKATFNKDYKDGFWKTTYNNKLVKTANWNKGFWAIYVTANASGRCIKSSHVTTTTNSVLMV